MFKHIIITKFNVRNYDTGDYQKARTGKDILTDEWMENRLELFEKYFLASLKGQTCKNFVCLVLLDENTRDKFKQQIRQLQLKYGCFEALYMKYAAEMNPRINQRLAEIVDQDTGFIISSRIDNDDAYHIKAVEYIQKCFVPEHNYAINLTKGYRFVHGDKELLLKNSFINGPFISLIEKYVRGHDITTVYSVEHNKMFMKYKMKQIKNKYLWLQNIHGFNLANDAFGVPIFKKSVLKDFCIDPKNIHLTITQSILLWLKFRLDLRNYLPFNLRYKLARYKEKLIAYSNL